MIEVAIVGGGPAGSYCAYSLAKNNVKPVIFDHSHPREKPCGGLVTPATQELFPFLKDLPIGYGERKRLWLISPSGRKVGLSARRGKIRCFSRLKLDQFLLDMAVNIGAELIRERVTDVGREGGSWKIKTTEKSYVAKTIVGADGVNSLVRRNIIGQLSKADKGICYGYLVRGLEEEEIMMRFLPHRKGYMWIVPRDDHTSLGIGASEASLAQGLRKELDLFIMQNCANFEKICDWAALVPNVKDVRTFNTPVAGYDWVLIGDAAGHVGAMVGDGIMYALVDGELAAQAIVEGHPQMFDKWWKEAYGWRFFRDIRLRKWLYTRPGLELYCNILKVQDALHI
jgi:digeranylgeranylglycerophospholipid reductase